MGNLRCIDNMHMNFVFAFNMKKTLILCPNAVGI